MQSPFGTHKRYYIYSRKTKRRGCMALRDNTFLIGAAAAAGAAGLAALYYVSVSRAEGANFIWDYLPGCWAGHGLEEQGMGSGETLPAQNSHGQQPCQHAVQQPTDRSQQMIEQANIPNGVKAAARSPASGEQLAVRGECQPDVGQCHEHGTQLPHDAASPIQQERQNVQQQQQQQDEGVVDDHHQMQLQHSLVAKQQGKVHKGSEAVLDAHEPAAAAAGQSMQQQQQQQQQVQQLERQSSSFKLHLSEWELRLSSPTAAAAAAAASGSKPRLSLSPRSQEQQQTQQPTTTQQQQQECGHEAPAAVQLHAPTRRTSVDSNWSPASTSSAPFTPSVAGQLGSSSSIMKQRTPINTTRKSPSLDITVASAAVARSLRMQYVDEDAAAAAATAAAGGGGSGPRVPVRSLATWCAVLCEQHCTKLQDISGEWGETTALDIGCGTGGCCFQLALSFSHVLGLDGDLMHVVAAKEMKDRGQLEYHPLLDDSCPTTSPVSNGGGGCRRSSSSSSSGGGGSSSARRVSEADGLQLDHNVTCLATVSEDVDRDKVRFWSYPLPDLPPKLQPVDAVLIEDVTGRLGPGLSRVLEQIHSLLNPQGVCVVVLDGSSSGDGATAVSAAGAEAEGAELIEQGNGKQDSAAATATAAAVQPPIDAADSATWSDSVQSMDHVKQCLQQQGLQFVKEQRFVYPVMGSAELRPAHAGVWLQQ